ncbi:cupin domain-containing protein [Paraburkholderia terrae]|uniref:Cupin domain-containing protein n=1 Tax=Paraburkholderia terrae TaxID=311230 RepID=A0A2I8F6N6_9BURK|nr:cupin domain-containing protein [Paraburkholderia terrae]AUT66724.1 cupin domain-containing protein [Paraburkholderia terrae]
MTVSEFPKQDRHKSFYERISKDNLSPLWQRSHILSPNSPAPSVVPAHWDYDGVVRPHIFTAGDIVSADEAEGRVLILENPGLPGSGSVTQTLYAGFQLVLPGEVARAYHHSQSAVRFVIEGDIAYTTAGEERVEMNPGDFLLAPSWRWHEHGNETEPMVWLDGLDIPIASFFSGGFAESAKAISQEKLRPPCESAARYSNNMLPVDWKPDDRTSPILRYPYERSDETLRVMSRGGEPDACHGYKVRFINPTTGGAPTTTISAFVQRFPEKFETAMYQSTDSTVFTVVEGHGQTKIGSHRIKWKPRDVFVAPSWHPIVHRCEKEATLLSFSDRAAQEALGIWREARYLNRKLV